MGDDMDKKTILLDIDGTLVDYADALPASAVQAVQEAKENGHTICLCTGRTTGQIDERLRALEPDGIIAGNGNYVEYRGDIVYYDTIPEDVLHEIISWLDAHRLPFFLETNNGVFASPSFRDAGLDVAKRYRHLIGESEDISSYKEAFPSLVDGESMDRADVNKVSFVLSSYEDFQDAKAAFPQLAAGTWGGWGKDAIFGELGLAGVSKATGLQKLVEHCDINLEDTLGFGDAIQDIPMLQACGIGVAMGNGCEEIKAVADYVTGAVQEDGLYKAFVHLGLIDLEGSAHK